MGLELRNFLSIPHNSRGVSYTCASLAAAQFSPGFNVSIFTPRLTKPVPMEIKAVEALPRWSRKLPYRTLKTIGTRLNERNFRDSFDGAVEDTVAAHMWGDPSVELVESIKKVGVTTFKEMTNCHRGSAKKILDGAYEGLGFMPEHGITEARVKEEEAYLSAVDFIFSPSPMVDSTLIENGVPVGKIIPTSYGWDPERFTGEHKQLAPIDGVTFLFVGRKEVPKGVHILLDAWNRSRIEGRLILAGDVSDDAIKKETRKYGYRKDVVFFDYVSDMGALYRSADVFVFPSLVEGGPQVTYEACGCGLPVIAGPMGAGRVVRHGREGLVVNSDDVEAWVAAMRELAMQPELRTLLGEAAYVRAQQFTWQEVGKRRREAIREKMRFLTR